MKKLSDKLRQLMQHLSTTTTNTPPSTSPATTETAATLNSAGVRQLMQLLEKTQEEEFSCQETFALLDEYVELVDSNEEAAALMPIVRLHLEMCPDCRDEFEALLRILRTEPPYSPQDNP
jgi:hypothetical protein